MIRSLFSAVSGLESEQTAMDVIGNNIANLNTVGFKASTTDFSEAFNQTSRIANEADPIGLNVGLGTRVVGTTTDFSQGGFETTNVPSNVAISGSGFFTVNTESTAASSNTYYTRAGDFVVDTSGNLRTAEGYYVQGYTGTGTSDGFTSTLPAGYTAPTGTGTSQLTTSSLSNIQIPTEVTTSAVGVTPATTESVTAYSIGTDGSVTVTTQSGSNVVVGYLTLTNFTNESGLNDQGGDYYASTKASGTAAVYQANNGPVGSTQGGTLELSNADVATEFSNMVITQRAYDADAKVITTSSEMLQTAVQMVQ